MTIEEWAKDFKSYVNELQMFRDDYNGIMEYIDDALALLKEQEDALEQMRLDNTDLRNCNAELMKAQEAKQVIKQTYHVMTNRDYENPVEVTRYDWLCPTCKSLLCRDIDVIDDNYHFCKVCGQAVKWNG